jgi:hypothetical protein
MAKDSDQLAGAFERDRAGGVLSGLFAEENDLDRRSLWRIGSWGVGAVATVTLAVMANQTSLGWRREQVAAADLARQAQQIQSVARESQVETRRLASAIDTLNGDRDRLYSRVTGLEQGLDSVTGAIARQNTMGPPVPIPAANAKTLAANPATTPGTAPAPGPSATAPSPTATSTTASLTPVADLQLAPKAQAAPAVAPVATTAAILPPEKPRPAETPKKDTVVPEPAVAMGPPPPPPPAQAAPNPPAAVPSTATPLVAAKSMMAPPDPAASKLIEPARFANGALPAPAAAPPALDAAASDVAKEWVKEATKQPTKAEDSSTSAAVESAAPEAAVQRTVFAVDLGGANSVGGLRALWRGLLKSNTELSDLRPIIMVKESHTGLGMQLRLAAGPLKDAAAAAKICAALTESERSCETTVFDGQRLAMTADEVQGSPGSQPAIKAAPAPKGGYYRRGTSHHSKQENTPAPAKPETSTFSSLFGVGKH